MKQTPKTFKELFANTGIEPTTDESGNVHYNFKATLKEEPKQDLLHKCTCLRPQTNCFSGMCSYCNRQIVKNLTTEDLKTKQETLEEAKKYAELSYYGDEVDAFVRGAKWQQEQDKNKYSDEEVIQLLIKFNQEIQEVENVRVWFEQFKKK